jgi:hypothetical protein
MEIGVSHYATGPALRPAVRDRATAAILRLAADLATDNIEAIVSFDLGRLAEIFAGWDARLPKTADHRLWHLGSQPDRSMIVILRHGGRVIGTAAQRLVWLHGTLANELRSGRFFYGDADPPADWHCSCSIAMADLIAYCPIVYTCAFRMELEGLQLSRDKRDRISWRALRLSQALAATHWAWSWMIARSDEGIALRYAPAAGGFTSFAKGLEIRAADPLKPGALQLEKWQHMMFARRDDIEQQLQLPAFAAGETLAAPMPLFPEVAK